MSRVGDLKFNPGKPSMKSLKLSLLLISILATVQCAFSAQASDAENIGWTLAVHSYTFRLFTIFDAIDKTAALGIKHMSLSGSVLLAKDAKPVGSVTLADKDMEAIKAKMISDGI